jgi:elongation of very long chain fatty acids protein 6
MTDSLNYTRWDISYSSEGEIDYSSVPLLVHPSVDSYSFEKFSSVSPWLIYMNNHKLLGVVLGYIYILAVFSLQYWMRKRTAIELKWPLILWNLAIGVFSIVGCIRTAPDLFHTISQPDGFYQSICIP